MRRSVKAAADALLSLSASGLEEEKQSVGAAAAARTSAVSASVAQRLATPRSTGDSAACRLLSPGSSIRLLGDLHAYERGAARWCPLLRGPDTVLVAVSTSLESPLPTADGHFVEPARETPNPKL